MSAALRQSELFAGADWQVLYRAFTDVNFNASDPPSINRALRAYIQQNYPENFNDWIESSEFVALIDLLSWLAGTLAFKTDINARESFLETAETRDSILRLARFISYNPRRNQCGQGIVKLVEVMTDDDVLDGFGTNLNNTTIQWDNPDDADWFERFLLVLNSAFISTNQFGVPLKSGLVSNVKTQLYRFNNVMSDANLGFTAKVSGTTMDFELANADFDDGGGFFEREPDYQNAFNLFYRNDGNGNSSSQTGFFMLFKQGTTQRNIFNISVPIENNVLDVNTANVNDSDVWVQTINDAGTVLASWSRVPAIFNENITYNNYDPSIRNVYSVITRDNDQISVRFSDGRFGAVPTGNIRIFYRTSNGLQYQIRPADMNRIKIPIPYYNRRGVKKTLTLTFSLQSAVSNSTPRETDQQIKSRAPSVYATQNRMVSGEDYNTFPLQSNLAVKLKAINRVYSGHSRFIDLNDPTGNYQDVNVFSDDGLFYRETYPVYTEIPASLNPSASDIVTLYMQPMLDRSEVINYASDFMLSQAQIPSGVVWRRATTDGSFSSTGYFPVSDPYLLEGATVLFDIGGGNQLWATIAAINGVITDAPSAGSPGPVTLSLTVPDEATVIKIIPAYTPGLDSSISTICQASIASNTSFSLWFDYTPQASGVSSWSIQSSAPTGPLTDGTKFKVMEVIYSSGGMWSISAYGIRYVFESLSAVEWYNDGRKTTDEETGLLKSDVARVLGVNEDLSDDGRALGRNYDLNIDRIYFNPDGSTDPKRVTVNFADENLNGYADDPDTFEKIISPEPIDQYLFWQNTSDGNIPLMNVVAVFGDETLRANSTANTGTVAFQIGSTTPSLENTFWVKQSSGWELQRMGAYTYNIGRGPNVAAYWVVPVEEHIPGTASGEDWWEEVFAPTIVTPPNNATIPVSANSSVYINVYATDPQDDPTNFPVTYLVGGSLPAGLSLNANTGVISGTATSTGSFQIHANNGVLDSTSHNLTIQVV